MMNWMDGDLSPTVVEDSRSTTNRCEPNNIPTLDVVSTAAAPYEEGDDDDHHHHWFPQHSQEESESIEIIKYHNDDDHDDINEEISHSRIRSNHHSTSTATTTAAPTEEALAMMTTDLNYHRHYHIPQKSPPPPKQQHMLHRQSSELTNVVSNRTTNLVSRPYPIRGRSSYEDDNDEEETSPPSLLAPPQHISLDHSTGSYTGSYNHMQPPPPRLHHTLTSPLAPNRDNDISEFRCNGLHNHLPNDKDNSDFTNRNMASTTTSTADTADTMNHLQYFRVVFQGVVAILASSTTTLDNNMHIVRTGRYVSYGEIICGRLGTSSLSSDRQHAPTIVQINSILTGGYAMDADATTHAAPITAALSKATTKFDTDSFSMDTTTSPDYKRVKSGTNNDASDTHTYDKNDNMNSKQPQWNSNDINSSTNNNTISSSSPSDEILGHIYAEQDAIRIVEPITATDVPHIETGIFHYRVICTTPIPIVTGPDINAPKTKAFLLPGTIQEISVRVRQRSNNASDISFLRLSYRRGWIADRNIIPPSTPHSTTASSIVIVQEVITTDTESRHSGDGGSITTGSVNSGTVSLSFTSAAASTSLLSIVTTKSHHRHRPPRKRQDAATMMPSSKTPFSSNRTIDGDKMMILPRHILDGKSLKKGITNDPSSNSSFLSDDSSLATNQSNATTKLAAQNLSAPASPNISISTNTSNKSVTSNYRNGSSNNSTGTTAPSSVTYFLMRVLAPKGMKILDAPQFQVNRLIRNGKPNPAQSGSHVASSSHLVSQMEPIARTHTSIFHTMSSRLTSTGKSTATGNVAVFDINSKTRILPCGALFESSRRMETTGSYNQGAGLIKLSDSSGWAIVPRQSELEQQYLSFKSINSGNAPPNNGETNIKSYEEVGSAIVDVPPKSINANIENHPASISSERRTEWIRVVARTGVPVSCPPPSLTQLDVDDNLTSPSSSRESSAIASSNNPNNGSSNNHAYPSNDSDVASSVGSAFLDALFRTPQKKKTTNGKDPNVASRIRTENMAALQSTIPCGMFLEVERSDDTPNRGVKEFARLRGGQGWVPLVLADKPTTTTVPCRPVFRYGSIWFRVQATRGIKVRFGPSNRASSIKSEDGEYFRFECGEFLRASETITSFSETGEPLESFAKLYRNRHVQLHSTYDEFRSLPSLTIEAEWVQIHNDTELFLEECITEPRIERHKQGWRYNVVPDNGIAIRKGPSFAAERSGVILFGGESVVINERVTPAGDHMSWLRLKDGQGWIHDHDENGEQIVVLHSLRHRAISSRLARKPEASEIPYNAIVSRLFYNDGSQRPTER